MIFDDEDAAGRAVSRWDRKTSRLYQIEQDGPDILLDVVQSEPDFAPDTVIDVEADFAAIKERDHQLE